MSGTNSTKELKMVPFLFGIVVIIVIVVLSLVFVIDAVTPTFLSVPATLTGLVHYLFKESGIYNWVWVLRKQSNETNKNRKETDDDKQS